VQLASDAGLSGDLVVGGAATFAGRVDLPTQTYVNNTLLGAITQVLITGCTPSDSWLVHTDNTSGPFQAHVTASFDPALVSSVASKPSPVFSSNTVIVTDENWTEPNGWVVKASSNNDTFRMFDSSPSTSWTRQGGFSTGGYGGAWVQIEYLEPVTMHSFLFDNSPGPNTQIREWTLQGSNDNAVFTDIQSYVMNDWGDSETFQVSTAHEPYRYWRIAITRKIPISNTNTFQYDSIIISNLKFFTGWSVGRIALSSVLPVDDSSFKIVMADTDGRPVSMLDTPVSWDFNIMLTQAGKIVNSGRYSVERIESGGGVVTEVSELTPISITGVTPSDSWIVLTDNTSGTLQVTVTEAAYRALAQVGPNPWEQALQPPENFTAVVVPIDSASFKVRLFDENNVLQVPAPSGRTANGDPIDNWSLIITIKKHGRVLHNARYMFRNIGGSGTVSPMTL
jgi:hypothetical protein